MQSEEYIRKQIDELNKNMETEGFYEDNEEYGRLLDKIRIETLEWILGKKD